MSDAKADKAGRAPTANWQRWEMSDITRQQARRPALAASAAQRVSLPAEMLSHLEELGRTLRDQARREGEKKGYAEGHKKGHAEGKAEGEKAGRAEGHAAGFQAGRQEGLKKAAAEAARLNALATACAQSLDALEADVGQALINLAVSIARQVVRSTLETHPDKILDTVRDVLHQEDGQEGVLRLRVHPDDLPLVREHIQNESGGARWRLAADESLERGGCVAETALGDIDATLETRWRRVTASLGREHPWKADA